MLWDRWRNVWVLAWERQRRLQDKLNYLLELEKIKNFSWDEWRKRVSNKNFFQTLELTFNGNNFFQFLKFMNHKKSRLTDLFRKMDIKITTALFREMISLMELSKQVIFFIYLELFKRNHINLKLFPLEFDTSKLEMETVANLFWPQQRFNRLERIHCRS